MQKIVTILAIALFFFVSFPQIHAQIHAQYSCVQSQCIQDPAGTYNTPEGCRSNCKNALCARGFEPACNFTEICKVYGFAITLTTTGAAGLALIMFLYGSFKYVTARGVEGDLEKARTVIVNAGIGFIIVVLAYSITRIILTVTGQTGICFT